MVKRVTDGQMPGSYPRPTESAFLAVATENLYFSITESYAVWLYFTLNCLLRVN